MVKFLFMVRRLCKYFLQACPLCIMKFNKNSPHCYLYIFIPGKKQPNLQLLLESLYAHMTRAVQLIDNFPHSGSSIHFKAEVTLMVGECTKDALLHNMEESACISITWANQSIVDAKSRRPIVAIYVSSSYLEIVLVKSLILIIPAMPFFFDIVCSFMCLILLRSLSASFICSDGTFLLYKVKLTCSIFFSNMRLMYILCDLSIVEL